MTTREEIIQEIKSNEYFDIRELVCKHTYDKFGEKSWQFLDTELLHTILVIRKNINRPMTVNNWSWGGVFSQRGLRCNICQIPREKTIAGQIYLSAHCNGAGIDFDVSGMTADEVRRWIYQNQILLPYNVRLENGVTWVHLDVFDAGTGNKVSYFNG
jgi:hypothetical protein